MDQNDFKQAGEMWRLWLETLSRLGGSFASAQPGSPPPEAARQVRGAVLNAVSEQVDQFLRSETFLQWMKEWLDRTIAFQKQTHEIMTQMHHATEGVAVQDVTAIMGVLRQMEDRLLDRLDDLNRRVERLEKATCGEGAPS